MHFLARQNAGQMQGHENTIFKPQSPMIAEALLLLHNELTPDEIETVNAELIGKLPAVQRAILEKWFLRVELAQTGHGFAAMVLDALAGKSQDIAQRELVGLAASYPQHAETLLTRVWWSV